MKIKNILILILTAGVVAVFVQAQTGVGHILVEVKDADGKSVQGASVLLKSTQKDLKRENATAKNGRTTLRFIDFGDYQIEISKEGYKVIHVEFTNRGGSPEAISQARATGRILENSADIGPDQALLGIYLNPGFEVTYVATLATDEVAQSIWQKQIEALAPAPTLTPEERLARVVEEIMPSAQGVDDALRIVGEKEAESATEDALAAIARWYEERGDTANALMAYTKLAELAPTHLLWYKIGRINYEQKDHARAITSFEKAVALAPSDYETLLGLGLSYEAGANKAKAIEIYEKIINLHSDKAVPYERLVALYNETRQYKKAEAALKRLKDLGASAESSADAKSTGPNAIDIYNEAVICLNRGDNAGAKKAFESAVNINPDLSEAHYQLGILYMNLGQCAKVIEHFEKFLSLDRSKGDPQTAESLMQYCKTQVKK